MGTNGTNGAAPRQWWLAADDVDGLLARLDTRSAALTDQPPGDGPVRLGIVDPDERKVRLARRLVAKGAPWRGRSDIWFSPDGLARPGRGGDGSAGKVAFLFPGVEPTFHTDALDLPTLGGRLGLEAPTLEDDTIPHRSRSIYRLGLFLDVVLQRLGIEPDLIAGHSIGEWSGTVAAGIVPRDHADEVVSFIDVDTVELPDVDFAALAAGVSTVEDLIAGIDDVLVSHDNCPNQAVICGPPERIDQALAQMREANVLGYKLDFQSGFHTPAIAPLIESIRALANQLPFRPAQVPMWSSTIVGPYPVAHDDIVDLHLRHLVEPVRFRPLIERLYHEAGARIFVQAGLGSLTGFVSDTLADHDHAAVSLLAPKRSALAQVQRALTALWVEGLDVSLDALDATPPPAPAPKIAAAAPAAPSSEAPAAPSPAAEPAPSAFPSAAAAPTASYPLVAAVEMVSSAARAGQEVIDALAARLGMASAPATAPPATASPTVAVGAGAAVAGATAAPAPAPTPAPPTPPPTPAAPARAAAPPSAPTARQWPTEAHTIVRHLSLDDMPETLDHTLYQQPEGWTDVSDLFPIVAMTSQIAILREVAAEYAGERQVVSVAVKNMRWLDLSSPVDVEISVVPKSDHELYLTLSGFCRALVTVGDFPPAPRYEPTPLTNPRPPTHTAQDLWDKRLMFHGPRFQGIDDMGPIGDDGILGTFRKLDTPGVLLDNLGKLIAYMAIDQGGIGEGALPVGVDGIEFFGPTPPVGTEVRCDVRLVSLEPDLIRANGVLVLPDGTVWCRVSGWHSLVFHLDEVMEPLYHVPDRHFAVEPQPGGWNFLLERWPMGAARELTGRRFMSRPERDAFAAMNLLDQRRWLLQLVAAKDTARRWLWETYGTPCYPIQMSATPEGDGRFRVHSPLIPEGHDLRVTVSQLEWLSVAVLGDGGHRDIEARLVPDGTDPAVVADELAAAMAARHPGATIGRAAGPTHVVPSRVAAGPPPRFAVAWTAATTTTSKFRQ